MGYKESGGTVEAVPASAAQKERNSGELAMEIGEFSSLYTRKKDHFVPHLWQKLACSVGQVCQVIGL